MIDWFQQLMELAGQSPPLQATMIALATFVLEDPTTIAAGIMAADGRIECWVAMLGAAGGIIVGDMGLYWIGRFAGSKALAWRLLTPDRLDAARQSVEGGLFWTVALSRLAPGLRLPTYLGAGVLKASPWRFLIAVSVSTIVWTIALVYATVRIGSAMFDVLGALTWPLIVLALVGMVAAQFWLRRRRTEHLDSPSPPEPVASVFEFWPPALFYIPVVACWMWLAIRHRGLLLPMGANPSIYSGGFLFESKSQILELLPEETRGWAAPHVKLLRRAADECGHADCSAARQRLAAAGIGYPVVAKPDVGQRGDGVRKIGSDAELLDYLVRFPAEQTLILQRMARGSGEAGILYFRQPDESRGQIFSITLKEFPVVVGDGRLTLRELILADPRARLIADVYLDRHREHLDDVPSSGEHVPLVFAGNHAQGAIFRDGTELVTDALSQRFDEIAQSIPQFYFGRFDVRYERLEDLLEGRGFEIVEINGAGAEATHIWDARMTLRRAYRVLFEQFGVLFEIGATNRRHGYPPIGLRRFLADWRAYRRLSQTYPSAS